jgi:hypothetical protein
LRQPFRTSCSDLNPNATVRFFQFVAATGVNDSHAADFFAHPGRGESGGDISDTPGQHIGMQVDAVAGRSGCLDGSGDPC